MSDGTPNQKPPKPTPVVGGLIRAERLTQIAFILPAAVLVGWLAGAGLDKWLHQHWIYLVGILLGLSRLAADSEITAMRAVGISSRSACRPVRMEMSCSGVGPPKRTPLVTEHLATNHQDIKGSGRADRSRTRRRRRARDYCEST